MSSRSRLRSSSFSNGIDATNQRKKDKMKTEEIAKDEGGDPKLKRLQRSLMNMRAEIGEKEHHIEHLKMKMDQEMRIQSQNAERDRLQIEVLQKELESLKHPQPMDAMNEILNGLLSEGIFVRKYNRRGMFKFKRFIVDFEDGVIDYGTGQFELEDLVEVKKGIRTETFHKSHDKGSLIDNVDSCLSLIFKDRSLDIQTATRLEAKCVFNALSNYLKQVAVQKEEAMKPKVKIQEPESYGFHEFMANQSKPNEI